MYKARVFGMHSLKSLLVSVLFLVVATSAQAITFKVDELNSSVTLTNTATGFVCGLTNCGVSAELADGIGDTMFNLNNEGETNTFDFLTFTGSGTGVAIYDIVATLTFNPPNISTTSGGSGGALLFFGSIVGAVLTWDDVPALLVLNDGSEVSVDFEGGLGLFLGNSVTTSASVTLEKVAPVPLPASALMLLLGLGGLAGVSRLKKKAA